MTDLWGVRGSAVHLGYRNLQEARARAEQQIRSVLDGMWGAYEPYADPDFPSGFARDPEGRFWEMYLGCRLLEANKRPITATFLKPATKAGASKTEPEI